MPARKGFRNKLSLRKNRKIKRSSTKRRGGMFRAIQKKIPTAEKVAAPLTAVATRYGFNDPVLPRAEAEIIVRGKYDTATDDEQLFELYNDILNGHFPWVSDSRNRMLERYPEFDVNIKDLYGRTLLRLAIEASQKKVAENVINSPTINRATLDDGLDCLLEIPKRNKTQTAIRDLINKKIREIEGNP